MVRMKRETGEIQWIDSGAAPATVSEVFCFLPLCEIRMGRLQNNRDNTTLASPETGLISMNDELRRAVSAMILCLLAQLTSNCSVGAGVCT